MTIKAIETRFDGYKFRSRTEARWAVFFKAAGIPYEYEKEGFDLDGHWYLPDFWLPKSGDWFEVKGEAPSLNEKILCELLAEKSGKPVLVAIGAPDITQQQVTVCWPEPHQWLPGRHRFTDRYSLGGKPALFLETTGAIPLCDFERLPYDCVRRAYQAAKEARFEHGQTPSEFPPQMQAAE